MTSYPNSNYTPERKRKPRYVRSRLVNECRSDSERLYRIAMGHLHSRTLWECYAAAALNAYISMDCDPRDCATAAARMADAMIDVQAEREEN